MCNATNKNGLKCKLSKSYGEYCHKHSYLDDDFQPGALENIKPKEPFVPMRLHMSDELTTGDALSMIVTGAECYDWFSILHGCLSLFFK